MKPIKGVATQYYDSVKKVWVAIISPKQKLPLQPGDLLKSGRKIIQLI